LLVGAAAQATGQQSQRAMLSAGVRQLGRAIVPWLAGITAILIGGLAMVIPGLLLLALFSLAAASSTRGVQPALAESARIVRSRWVAIGVVLLTTFAVQAALLYLAERMTVKLPLTKKPTFDQIVGSVRFVHLAVASLVITAPIAAVALAKIRERSMVDAARVNA
jgi:hypothetical protein